MDRAIVIYDSDCGFCRWMLGKVLAWDRRGVLRPIPLGSPEADRLLEGMPRELQYASWHLARPEGTLGAGAPAGSGVVSAGAAIPPTFRMLPGGRPLAWLLERAPSLPDRTYAWIARNRSTLGRPVTAAAKRRADARIAAAR